MPTSPDPLVTEWVPVWDIAGGAVGGGGGGGTPAAHHFTHETGGTDPVSALSGSVINSGTVADARLSSNVPLKNAANAFTQPQYISGLTGTAALVITETGQPVDAKVFIIQGAYQQLRLQAINDAGNAVQGEVIMGRTGILNASAGLGATPLNASQLTSGAVPDARLSANVPLKNAVNVFTSAGNNTFQGQCVFAAPITYFETAAPQVILSDTNQPADQRRFQIGDFGGRLYFQAVNDAISIASGSMYFDRAGGLYISGPLTAPNAFQWVDEGINPANYFANPSGSATFVDAIPYVYRYLIMGKTLFFQVGVRLMAGDFTNEFRVHIPSGLTIKPYQVTGIPGSNNQIGVPAHWANVSSIGSGLAMAFIDTINNCISIQRADDLGASWTSGNAYILRFSIDVPLA